MGEIAQFPVPEEKKGKLEEINRKRQQKKKVESSEIIPELDMEKFYLLKEQLAKLKEERSDLLIPAIFKDKFNEANMKYRDSDLIMMANNCTKDYIRNNPYLYDVIFTLLLYRDLVSFKENKERGDVGDEDLQVGEKNLVENGFNEKKMAWIAEALDLIRKHEPELLSLKLIETAVYDVQKIDNNILFSLLDNCDETELAKNPAFYQAVILIAHARNMMMGKNNL